MNTKGLLTLLLFNSCFNATHAQLPSNTHLDELNSFNGFEFSSFASSFFASSTAKLGDINGDGIDDIAIADSTADSTATDTGSVYVLYGNTQLLPSELSVADIDGIIGVEFIGEQALGQAGWSVQSAGDFNNDGVNDMIIGALTVDNGPAALAGAAYVVYGDPNGYPHPFMLADLDGTNGFKVYGLEHFDLIGRTVNTVGDINNDTIDDVIVCTADKAVGPLLSAGQCYVIFGNAAINSPFDLSTLNGSNGLVIKSATENEFLGFSAGSAGDFNNDGIDDMYISAGNLGRAYVFYGQSSSFQAEMSVSDLNGTNGFTITDATALSPTPISTAGDFNQDGSSDLIIGNSGVNNFQGVAQVLFGSNAWPSSISLDDIDANNSLTIHGANENDQTGYAVSNAGDVNGDGADDIMTSSPFANQGNGLTHVIYGGTNLNPIMNVTDLNGENGATIIGENLFNGFAGQILSAAGDFNHDGTADIIIGAPNVNRSYVVLSNDVIFANGLD